MLISARAPRDQARGQGLAEYALILALIAMAVILGLVFLGDGISQILASLGGKA